MAETQTIDEIARLLPGPGSIVRQRATDVRLFGVAGYALMLQVAHPTIAAGVRDHSDYVADPWGRFFRTADFVNLLVYGSPETAAALAMSLREMHRDIRGTDPAGRAYSALEPSAYAWVHATLAEAIVRGHTLFGKPLTPAEREDFWAQWRALGQVLGVREGDLPATWASFQAYLTRMIDEVLETNDMVDQVLATADHAVGGTPWRWLDERWWALVGWPLGRYGAFLATGSMPHAVRAKVGLPWSRRQDALFRGVAAAHRAATVVMPRGLRKAGPIGLRLRRREIATGPFADAVA